jgi:rhodanese-related sulfurtransferase
MVTTTMAATARGIDQMLDDARLRIRRRSPEQAHFAYRRGSVLVDIRPEAQRATHGQIPGSLVIERNVLEWRFDPRSSARLEIANYDLDIIVVCQEGYTSSLAAAALQDLGLYRASDLDGGFAAWKAAGLPTF